MALPQFWQTNFVIIPNLGLDLVFLAFSGFGTVLGGQLTLAAALITSMLSMIMLTVAAHRRMTPMAAVCALLLYNRMLLAGVVNYIFGYSVAVMGLAVWIMMRDTRALYRGAVLCGFMALAALCHIFGLVVLLLLLAGHELVLLVQQRFGWRQIVQSVLVPTAALLPVAWIILYQTPQDTGRMFIFYRPLIERLAAFAVPLTYEPALEAVGFAAILACLAVALGLRQARANVALLGSAALLGVVQLVMPNAIGAGTGADHRLPIVIWMVGFCAIDLRLRQVQLARGMMVAVAIFALWRLDMINSRWSADNRIYRSALQALDAIPDGAMVATACPPDAWDSVTGQAMSLYFLPAWNVVPRGGFTQTLWTKPSQHPLVMQPGYRALADATGPMKLWAELVGSAQQNDTMRLSASEQDAIQRYDFIAFLSPFSFNVRKDEALQPFRKADGIQIFRVMHRP